MTRIDRLMWRYLLALTVSTAAILGCAVLAAHLNAQEGVYDWSKSRTLYPGIQYARVAAANPRSAVINCLRIDSQTPKLRFHATGRYLHWVDGKQETKRKTVRNFMRDSQKTDRKLVVATNADAFSPWPVPYQKETPTDVLGLLVSAGTLVSRGSGTPSFLVTHSGELSIQATVADRNVTDIETAVSGFGLCLIDGQVPASGNDQHPRTGLGLSADGRYVLMMTIDGRQPASAGATTQAVGAWLKQFGAHIGINMDGGGSTTMAWWDPLAAAEDKCRLLNSPVGNGRSYDAQKARTQFQPSERANGSNLGVYFVK